MKRRDYEKLQLRLIAHSYIQKDFSVAYEAPIEGAGEYRFDAVARRGRDELVIIEMVNKRRSGDPAPIFRALEAIGQHYPHAKVDFRYIDIDVAAAHINLADSQGTAHPNLENALNAKLPRRLSEEADATRPFLDLWRLHVTLIRAYAGHVKNWYFARDSEGHKFSNNEGILEVYNDLLANGFLTPPEENMAADIKNLFELYDDAKGALEGARVSTGTFEQLRQHFMAVRSQIRGHFRSNFALEIGNPR